MPKVGKHRIQFSTDEDTQIYDIWYDQKQGFQIKGLPSDFLLQTSFKTYGYSTEVQLKNELRDQIDRYRLLKKTERKVLMYKIFGSTLLTMNKTGENHFSGKKRGVSNKIENGGFGEPECSVGVEYRLAREIDEGGKKYFEYREDGSITSFEMNNIKGWSMMDWTEERELFFKSMYNSMQNLVYKLSSFFNDNDEEVINAIDTAGSSFKLEGTNKLLE